MKFMVRPRSVLTFCLLLVLNATPVPAAQDSEIKTLFLVARPELREPIFKESVVLRLPSSVGVAEGLIVGLILNRPARIALSDIFADDKELENRSETAYFGGPVNPRAPGAVFRSSKPAKQATLLFDDIYVSFDPDFIRELLKRPKKHETCEYLWGAPNGRRRNSKTRWLWERGTTCGPKRT